MSAEMKNYVLNLLDTYQDRERKIAVLRYELEHPAQISPEEMIGAMSFARGDGTGRTEGHISNKTLYIALNYKDQADRINVETVDEVARRLVVLEQEQERLVYYVSLLDKRQADVLRLAYLDQFSWEEIARMLGVALRTAHKIKSQAVDKLVEMYAFAGTVK